MGVGETYRRGAERCMEFLRGSKGVLRKVLWGRELLVRFFGGGVRLRRGWGVVRSAVRGVKRC